MALNFSVGTKLPSASIIDQASNTLLEFTCAANLVIKDVDCPIYTISFLYNKAYM